MSDLPGKTPRLNSSLLHEIDRRCDAFEAALRSGQRPTPEEYLSGLSEPEHSVLLRELQNIELAYQPASAALPEADCTPTGDTPQPGPHTEPFRPFLVTDLAVLPARFGNYDLLDRLGQGGMGEVYRVRDLTADRVVALKIIRRDRLAELPETLRAEWVERFKTEARTAAHIEHQNVVPVYHVGEVAGHHFYSMRYIPGRNLTEFLQDGPLSPQRVAEIMEAVAGAVHCAHERGILHRDLKPRNIILDEGGRPYVADFGLAKWLLGDVETTATGALLGSPPYMAPEQVRHAATVTAAADIYSLGATLYYLLTSRAPFHADSLPELLQQVLDDEPLPPSRLQPTVNRDLETICLKCLEKEPRRRYASALELARDLGRFLKGEAILARRAGPFERLRKWSRRHPARAALWAVSAAFAVVVVVGSVTYSVNLRHERDVANQQRDLASANYQDLSGSLQVVVEQVENDWAEHIPEMQQSVGQSLLDQVDLLDGKLSQESRNAPEILLGQARLRRLRADADTMLLRHEDAEKYYLEALALFDRCCKLRPEDLEPRRDRATCLHNLGVLLYKQDRYAEAETRLDEALKARRELAVKGTLDQQRELAATYYFRGALFAKWPEHKQSAAAEYGKALALQEKLVAAAPNNLLFKQDLARTLNNQGIDYWKSGDLPAAAKAFEKARTLQEALVDKKPSVVAFTRYLAQTQYNQGIVLGLLGEKVRAEECYKVAIDNFEHVHNFYRQMPEYAQELAAAYLGFASFLESSSAPNSEVQTTRIKTAYAAGLSLRERLAADNRTEPRYQQKLVLARSNYGYFLMDRKRLDEAETEFRLGLKAVDLLTERYPQVADYQDDRANMLSSLARVIHARAMDPVQVAATVGNPGMLFASFGEWECYLRSALALLERSRIIHERLCKQDPNNAQYRGHLGLDHLVTAEVHAELGEHASVTVAAQQYRHLIRSGDSPVGLVQAAGVWCQYAARYRGATEIYQREALACLRLAKELGWDRAKDVLDRTFDPIRALPEFQELLKSMTQ